jgi:hypothetical protein
MNGAFVSTADTRTCKKQIISDLQQALQEKKHKNPKRSDTEMSSYYWVLGYMWLLCVERDAATHQSIHGSGFLVMIESRSLFS